MVATSTQHFGKRLEQAMQDRPGGQATVQQLADACGVSYQAVKKWLESDSPKLSAEYSYLAAKFLGASLEWLISGRKPALANQVAVSENLIPYGAERATTPDLVVKTLTEYVESLDEVLHASAKDILKRLIDGQMDKADATQGLDKLTSASKSMQQSKRTGT